MISERTEPLRKYTFCFSFQPVFPLPLGIFQSPKLFFGLQIGPPIYFHRVNAAWLNQ